MEDWSSVSAEGPRPKNTFLKESVWGVTHTALTAGTGNHVWAYMSEVEWVGVGWSGVGCPYT